MFLVSYQKHFVCAPLQTSSSMVQTRNKFEVDKEIGCMFKVSYYSMIDNLSSDVGG
jgi:hypothetical protein